MKEEDIRKKEVFDEYLRLVQEDIKRLLNPRDFLEAPCPACGLLDFKPAFQKAGFDYVVCENCATLFVNPRPTYQALQQFYSQSISTTFWVKRFFEPVAEVRRKEIFRPRAEAAAEMLRGRENWNIGDVGAGFGIFLEELKKLEPHHRYVAIEPSHEMADICRAKGFETERTFLEDLDPSRCQFDLLTVFELTEHLFDAFHFFKKLHQVVKPGGLVVLTTLNGKGFDIQLLWEKSKSVSPPHHLNFFNPKSLQVLLKRTGFETVEISTPGRLDWDIVEGMIRKERVPLGKFWEQFAESGNEKAKSELQEWISRNSLSSHMRCVARRLPG